VQNLKVRPAQISDIPAIYDITREAFSKYAHDLGKPEMVKALNDTEESILRDLKEKHILVGELNGKASGAVRYEFIEGVAYFSRFSVKLFAQSCGLGGALIKEVVNQANKAGCRAVALHTSSRMASLIRFYYNQGFFVHSVNTSRGYYRALLVRELKYSADCIDYASLFSDK